MSCTCPKTQDPETGLDVFTNPTELCGFCQMLNMSHVLQAADQRVTQTVDAQVTRYIDVDTGGHLSTFVDSILEDKEYISKGDLENELEDYLKADDLGHELEREYDFVTKSDLEDYVLEDDLQTKIEELLADGDLVGDVIKGGIQAGLEERQKLDKITRRLEDNLLAVSKLANQFDEINARGFWGKLRWLVGRG